jgi:hypothetical protein
MSVSIMRTGSTIFTILILILRATSGAEEPADTTFIEMRKKTPAANSDVKDLPARFVSGPGAYASRSSLERTRLLMRFGGIDPAAVPDEKEVRDLLKLLESDDFEVRNTASKKLAAMGAGPREIIEKELAASKSIEVRKRLQTILDASGGTETNVRSALSWLVKIQESDGHWDSRKYGAEFRQDTAVTSFALLALLGAGHTEIAGPYKFNVQRAVRWLKTKQGSDGMIWATDDDGSAHRARGYPTAIATLALCEAAAMGNVSDTRAAAQNAVHYFTRIHQVGEGDDHGGWRYGPKQEGDLSVSSWFIAALRAARAANLRYDESSWRGAVHFLDSVEHVEGGISRFWYMPGNPREAKEARLSAMGIYSRINLGSDGKKLAPSVQEFIKQSGVPKAGANGDATDIYFWYFGTLCAFQQGGKIWTDWNGALKKTLTTTQETKGPDAGSWPPIGDFSAEWGRVGQTALSAMCLEIYYRYSYLQPKP